MIEPTPNAAEPKSRRRWHQYSLRTLLIGVTLAGLPCAYVAHEAKIVAERRAWLEDHKRDAWLALQVSPRALRGFSRGNPGQAPSMLRRWLGDKAVGWALASPRDAAATAATLFPEAEIDVWRLDP
jgi:hypothetical protein